MNVRWQVNLSRIFSRELTLGTRLPRLNGLIEKFFGGR
jgi:hypothetical protein